MKAQHWRKLWRRNLRELSRYFPPWEVSRGPQELWHASRAATAAMYLLFVLKAQGKMTPSFDLPLFPFFGGAYLHLSCYLYSCPLCECEQHVQPLLSTLSVVMAASFSQEVIPCFFNIWIYVLLNVKGLHLCSAFSTLKDKHSFTYKWFWKMIIINL